VQAEWVCGNSSPPAILLVLSHTPDIAGHDGARGQSGSVAPQDATRQYGACAGVCVCVRERERERERESFCAVPIDAAAQPTCPTVRDLSSRRTWLIRVFDSQPEDMVARLEPVTCTRLCELAARDIDSNGVGQHSGVLMPRRLNVSPMSARQLELHTIDESLQESIHDPLPRYPLFTIHPKFVLRCPPLGWGFSLKIIRLGV
jgi:hypothetical protein